MRWLREACVLHYRALRCVFIFSLSLLSLWTQFWVSTRSNVAKASCILFTTPRRVRQQTDLECGGRVRGSEAASDSRPESMQASP